MTTELQTRYPAIRYFKFFSAVSQGFLASANAQSNNILRASQASPAIDHYSIPCSPSGSEPATHFGADGFVRAHEAYELYEYYDSLNRNDLDSWILTFDSMRLWSKENGWIVPIDGLWTYDQFLEATPPFLQRIIAEAEPI